MPDSTVTRPVRGASGTDDLLRAYVTGLGAIIGRIGSGSGAPRSSSGRVTGSSPPRSCSPRRRDFRGRCSRTFPVPGTISISIDPRSGARSCQRSSRRWSRQTRAPPRLSRGRGARRRPPSSPRRREPGAALDARALRQALRGVPSRRSRGLLHRLGHLRRDERVRAVDRQVRQP